jgi:hypothetical protein
MKWMVGVIVWACIPTVAASDAFADEGKAKAAFMRGVDHMKAGDYTAGVEDFEESYKQFPNKNSLSNLALCYFKLSRLSESLRILNLLLKDFKDNLTRKQSEQTQSRIDEIKALLPSIHVVTKPDGAMVTIDGEPIGETPLKGPVFLSAGEHFIAICKNGFETISWKDTFVAGTHEETAFALKMMEAPAPPAPPPPTPVVEPIPTVSVRELQLVPGDKPKHKMWSPLFIAGFTGTVVMTGVSIGLWAAGAHLYNDYEEANRRLAEISEDGTWYSTLEKERNTAETHSKILNNAAVVTTAVTGAFVALTAIVAVMDVAQKKETTVSVLPGGVEVRF